MNLLAHIGKAALNVGKATADGLAQRQAQSPKAKRAAARKRRQGGDGCTSCGAIARVQAAREAVKNGQLLNRS